MAKIVKQMILLKYFFYLILSNNLHFHKSWNPLNWVSLWIDTQN